MSDAGEWVLVGLDEKLARRQGVPGRVPVPKGEFEGIAETGLRMDLLKKWITGFLSIAPSAWRSQNAELATSFDRFLAKVDLWTKAQNAFGKEDFKTAISTLKLIGNLDPSDHAAKMNLGMALASSGDHAGALAQLEGIKDTFLGEADYHAMLGQLLAALGKKDQAIDELANALDAKPDHQQAIDMLRQLGVLVSIYENPKDAASLTFVRADAVLEYLASVWDKEPHDTAYFLEQAVYHATEGRHAIALAAAERAVKASEKPHERAEAARIGALRHLGRADDAVAAAKAFVAHDPKSSTAQVELAQALAAKGDAAGAKAAVAKALEIEPGNLVALDLAFWPQGKDKEDIAKVNEAIGPLKAYAEKHAKVPGAWRSLARAKLAVSSIDEAYELFKKALDLAKDDDDLRAEYWTELGRQTKYAEILADAANVPDMGKRDWKLRWNEAEALARAGKKVEARAAFTQINMDTSLHVDVRKRAKRAAGSVE
jgi:tetratricopeptide (TPR) repeat protein